MRTPDAHIGGPIEAVFDGEKEEPRSTVEGGPALTKPGLLSRADGEKEEGACGYGAFAALTETAEAEWSRLLPTWWSVGTLIRTPDPRIGGPIEACFDGEKEEPRSTVEGGPALTKPGLLSRAELGAPSKRASMGKRRKGGKGGRSLRIWSFRGSYGNRGSGMEQASSDVVELRGVEPLSENNLTGTSSGAVCYFHSLGRTRTNTLTALVAS